MSHSENSTSRALCNTCGILLVRLPRVASTGVRLKLRTLFLLHAAMRATFGLRQPELPLFKTLGFHREF